MIQHANLLGKVELSAYDGQVSCGNPEVFYGASVTCKNDLVDGEKSFGVAELTSMWEAHESWMDARLL